MNTKLQKQKTRDALGSSRNQPQTSGLNMAMLLGVAIIACVLGYLFSGQHNTPAGPLKAHPATSNDAATDELVPTASARQDHEVERHRPTLNRSVAPSKSSTAAEQTVSDATVAGPAQEIIGRLVQMDLGRSPVTAAQAEAIRQNISALAAQGPGAIPAIRAFLARNQDLGFEEASGRSAVGYATLRIGLFDAL